MLCIKILSAASPVLAEVIASSADEEIMLADVDMNEFLVFLLAIYPRHRFRDGKISSKIRQKRHIVMFKCQHHVLVVERMARIYKVQWLLEEIDMYLMDDGWDVNVRLMLAQKFGRTEILVCCVG